MPSEPISERPHMPGYGIPANDDGLLPWSWAVERLTKAHNYFVSTTRPNGAPHSAPVWGCWIDATFYFSCAASSRKAANIAADPRCAVCPEGAEEAVIVEGIASPVTAKTELERFKQFYDAKYNWDMDVTKGGIYIVRPATVFGFIEHLNKFQSTATRWRFPNEQQSPDP
ncbi:MAG: pyridoxamine 5'-phosphate oxidase family protein [Dehalococcoidia bacterium]